MKVVYNNCFGGFSVSDAGVRRYAAIKGIELHPEKCRMGFVTYWTVPESERSMVLADDEWDNATQKQRIASNEGHEKLAISTREFDRSDPALVQVVEELGEDANGRCANLAITEVEAGRKYRIDEYDGNESVMTIDDYAWQVAS